MPGVDGIGGGASIDGDLLWQLLKSADGDRHGPLRFVQVSGRLLRPAGVHRRPLEGHKSPCEHVQLKTTPRS